MRQSNTASLYKRFLELNDIVEDEYTTWICPACKHRNNLWAFYGLVPLYCPKCGGKMVAEDPSSFCHNCNQHFLSRHIGLFVYCPFCGHKLKKRMPDISYIPGLGDEDWIIPGSGDEVTKDDG